MGLPKIRANGFPLNLLEPHLAGMTPSTRGFRRKNLWRAYAPAVAPAAAAATAAAARITVRWRGELWASASLSPSHFNHAEPAESAMSSSPPGQAQDNMASEACPALLTANGTPLAL